MPLQGGKEVNPKCLNTHTHTSLRMFMYILVIIFFNFTKWIAHVCSSIPSFFIY